MTRTLTAAQVARFYDWFGSWQDWQLYERRALSALAEHASLGQVRAVFEFGCGTGRFAEQLLRDRLPPNAIYLGVDLSETMVRLATARLQPWADRAGVLKLTPGLPTLPAENGKFDRFISTYVLDLLSDRDAEHVISEAHRMLAPDGCSCLASLTFGNSLMSRMVTALWRGTSTLSPVLVGGCRPVRLQRWLPRNGWHVRHGQVVTEWGVPSEIVVACRLEPALE